MPTMLLPLMLFDAEQLPHKSGHSIEMSGSAASTTRRAVSEASSEAEHADGLERHTEAAEQRTVGSCRRVAIMIRVEATLRRRRYSSSVFSVPAAGASACVGRVGTVHVGVAVKKTRVLQSPSLVFMVTHLVCEILKKSRGVCRPRV